MERFQAVNPGKVKQLYEICLVVPGPPDSDLECGQQISSLHPWTLGAGKN